jgi:hypothetical protein
MTRGKFDFAIIGGGIVGTYLGRLLARQGRSVALIERGPASLSESALASPPIICVHRQHNGASQARNHLLGGNGYYWGGGLIRSTSTLFDECVGGKAASEVVQEDIEASFEAVERELGLHRPPSRELFVCSSEAIGPCYLAEMCVLPGKSRNVSLGALEEINKTSNCEILSGAELIAFERSSGNSRAISSVKIRHRGDLREILAEKFVISAGTIDSNLLMLAHQHSLGVSGQEGLGGRLHDHFSLPLFKTYIGASSRFRNLVAPSFEGGMVFGRRFELRSESAWGRGFLHFQFMFDDVSPYREIKKLLLLRQQAAGALVISQAALPVVAQLSTMLRIAFERYVQHRLYLADKLPVVATLDFESFPDKRNQIRLNGEGGAILDWDLHSEDELTFKELSEKSRWLISEFASSYGILVDPLCDFSDREAVSAYLHEKASDAFHLGGGIPVRLDNEDGVVERDMRLRGVDNVYVISCAVFRRPGLSNPTHTLLALANRFARQHGG